MKRPEGVKWELGFAYVLTGKIESLGLGIINHQNIWAKNKLGNGIWKKKLAVKWDL